MLESPPRPETDYPRPTSPIRVYEVINVRWYNATAWYAITQARLLQAHGHEVMVVCLPQSPAHLKALEYKLPVTTLELNTTSPLGLVRLYAQIHKLCKEFPPQIVNCHRGEAFILWGLLKLQTKKAFKLVRTRGDQRPPKNNYVNRWLHRSLTDAVVCTNTAMSRYFRDELDLPPERLWLIFGGVNRNRFRFDPEARQTARQSLGFDSSDKVVGLVGRYDWVKGQREFLEAAAKLYHSGFFRLKVLLIGFSSALPEAQILEWINGLGLKGIARVSGYRDDVAACISALDLGVINSLWSETIARAAFEIMSCGVPLIGTRVGVLPDLLSQEALLPPGDKSALCKKIYRLLSEQKIYARLRDQQQSTIRDLDLEHFFQHIQGLYTRLLNSPS